MKKHKKGIFDVFFAIAMVLFAALIIAFAHFFFIKQSVETLKFAEETTGVDTYLYVLLNNNYCTPNTKLPFKIVLGTELSKDPTPGPDEEITISYNYQEDKLKIKDCIEKYMERLQVGEYAFYIEYKGEKSMTIDTFKKEREDITTEWEYIVVPKNTVAAPGDMIAKAYLKIKIESKISRGSSCPEDENLRCVPRRACSLFGGICKASYACSPTKCCCKDLPL